MKSVTVCAIFSALLVFCLASPWQGRRVRRQQQSSWDFQNWQPNQDGNLHFGQQQNWQNDRQRQQDSDDQGFVFVDDWGTFPTRRPRPDTNNNNNNNNGGTTSRGPLTTTTGQTPTTTTASPPGYLDCMGRCQSTPEYNPICGSDRVTYPNIGRLRCANRCGNAVTVYRQGACRGL